MRADQAVTVCIPTIPPRSTNRMLPLALRSVFTQTHPAAAVSIAVDIAHEGAWVTRQRALMAVFGSEWVAFLDDDDWWYSIHLERLLACAEDTGADYVFSYFDTNMADPLGLFGREFDPANPSHTTMTILVRTELAQDVGFTPPHPGDIVSGEDWRFTLGCVEAGAKIVHLPERTWFWNWHPEDSRNTSGQPHNWP